MKLRDYSFKIGKNDIGFYHNTKTHRYDIVINYNLENAFNVTKAKGEAIAEFLRILEKEL